MSYQLQVKCRDDDWRDVTMKPKNTSNLKWWIKIGECSELFGDKYQYRIIDENRKTIWVKTQSYDRGIQL